MVYLNLGHDCFINAEDYETVNKNRVTTVSKLATHQTAINKPELAMNYEYTNKSGMGDSKTIRDFDLLLDMFRLRCIS